MVKLVHIAYGIRVNPEHVVSVRGSSALFYVEMSTGTRHELEGDMLAVIARLNGEDDENSG